MMTLYQKNPRLQFHITALLVVVVVVTAAAGGGGLHQQTLV